MNTRAPSTSSKYYTNSNVQNYISDWIISFVLLVYFFSIAEHANPFQRQFSITDLSISHPFAIEERVSGVACILLAAFVPLAIISLVVILKAYGEKYKTKSDHYMCSK
uniref:Uncharacterized protein n=1 Tax=Candida parapsilosis (strain CDC 317 / ATCC MYA-4646) TaxID=578454 RepID=A0AAJ8VYA3_CANPC